MAHNLDNSNNNFEVRRESRFESIFHSLSFLAFAQTGALDVFSGSDLRECNQFELGEISSSSDISKCALIETK